MESKKIVREGSVNQYTELLISELPKSIKDRFSEAGFDINAASVEIINRYLVSGNTAIDVIEEPDKDTRNKLQKRRKYAFELITENFRKNHEAFQKGEPCEAFSPFAQVSSALELGLTTREQAEEKLTGDFESWHKKMEVSLKNTWAIADRGELVGFSDYPSLGAYRVSNAGFYKKCISADLTTFIFWYRMKNALSPLYTPDTVMDVGMFDDGYGNNRMRQQYDLSDIGNSPRKMAVGFADQADIAQLFPSGIKLVTAGKNEQMLLFWIFSRAVRNFMSGIGNFTVSGSLTDICRVIAPDKKNFNSAEYEAAREAFNTLLYTRLKTEDGVTSVPLLGETSIDWANGGKETGFRTSLGADLCNDIMFGRVGVVFKDQLMKLSDGSRNGLSRLLYPKLRRDRNTTIFLQGNYTSMYTLIDLRFIARSTARYKKDRVREYNDAFQEMKDKHILIEDFKMGTTTEGQEMFVLTWLPLTEAEKNDLQIKAVPQAQPFATLVDSERSAGLSERKEASDEKKTVRKRKAKKT